MISILSRAGCFVAIIFLGMILRKVGYFRREDFTLLSKIVIRITLPAAINSFSILISVVLIIIALLIIL